MSQGPSGLGHRLAAVWFADIVGYTPRAAEDEDAALALVQRFQAAAREAVDREGGRIVKFLGDAALAEFASAQDAVRAALGLCQAFGAGQEADGEPPPDLRVGVAVSPHMDPLRHDPRFPRLLKRLGLDRVPSPPMADATP